MIVTIHQPNFLPWLGYFGKIRMADIFVILDTVQYVKNEYHNRNRLRTPEGWQWLTVPVHYQFPQSILDTRTDERQPWRQKHPKTIKQLYGKAPFFKEISPLLLPLYKEPWNQLAELNVEIIIRLMKILSINVPVYRASDLKIRQDNPTGRLIRICQLFEADTYLSGANGREYLEREQFSKAGLELKFQGFEHPEYPQRFRGFEPYMSAVDALFCVGAGQTAELIREYSRMEDE